MIGVHRQSAHDPAAAQEVRKQILGGNQARAEARAHAQHQPLRPRVVQGLVGRIHRVSQLQYRAVQQPLPVALVRGHQHDRFSRIEVLPGHAQVQDPHARGHVGGAHRQRLQHLHQHVAEIPEVLLVDRRTLRLAHVRKDPGELFLDDLVPVPNHVVRQPIQERGKRV